LLNTTILFLKNKTFWLQIEMLICILFGLMVAQNYPFQDSSLDIDTRLDNLLSLLTNGEKVDQIQNGPPPIAHLGIPAYNWWNEALHGVARSGAATSFPQTIGMAATFDDEALLKTFTMVSDEARAKV
jgi:beta-glucosidase